MVFHEIYVNLFISSMIDWLLDCFQLGDIISKLVNIVFMSFGGHISIECFLFLLGIYSELELLGYSVCTRWTWQDHTKCFPKWLKHQQCRKVLSNSHSHHHLPFQTWPSALLWWMHDGISVLLWLLTKLSSYLQTFRYVYLSSLRCPVMSFAHFGDTIINIFFCLFFWLCWVFAAAWAFL